MEQVLVDIAMEDEVGIAIIDKRVDFYYEYCKRGLEAGRARSTSCKSVRTSAARRVPP